MEHGTATLIQATERKLRPPYLPYVTFKAFIEKVNRDGMVHRIEKTMMGNLSGALQSHLMVALKSLELIDDKGHPRPRFEELVNAVGKPEWKATLGAVIQNAYSDIVGNIDLTKATHGQIVQAFKDAGTEGTLTDKALRFYLKALDDAGIKYSAYLPRGRNRGISRRSRRSADGGSSVAPPLTSQQENPQTETREYPLYFAGKPMGKIVVPNSITQADCKVIALQLAVIEASAAEAETGK